MSALALTRCAPRAAVLVCAFAITLLAAPRLAAAQGSVAAPTAAFDQVLHLLAARSHGRVSYTEVHQMAMLQRPLESSGELVYEAPDHLEKRTLAPRRETLILDHGVLTARRGHHTHALALRDYPQVVPFVESIRATLAGDRGALERYFHTHFEGDVGHWTLALTPADASAAHAVQAIRITGERGAILTVEIRQADGDRSLLTLGPEIPP